MNSDGLPFGKSERKCLAKVIRPQAIRIEESDCVRSEIQLNAIMLQDIHTQSDRVVPQVISEHFGMREQRSATQIQFGGQIHPIGSPVSNIIHPVICIEAFTQLRLQCTIEKGYWAAGVEHAA